MNKINYITILLLLISVNSGCSKDIETTNQKQDVKPVDTITAKYQSFKTWRTVSGTTFAQKDITLSAESSGAIESLPVSIGNKVIKNQILAKIDPEMASARKKAALANLKLAETTFSLQKKLFAKRLISDQQFESIRTQLKTAESQFQIAEIQYKKTTIRSPIDGIIAEKYIEENEFISPGQPVCRVINLDRIKIKIGVTGKDLPYIKINNQVNVMINTCENKIFKGVVSSTGSVADKESRTFPVEISIDNKNHKIKAGMLGRVSFINKRLNNVIVIPHELILEGETKAVFLAAKNNRAKKKPVRIIATEKNMAAISGISPGEHIVSAGHKNIVEGEVLKIINNNNKPFRAD
ncbi:MAG: efflux RND transporter periplasmic adaptor subunit [bacterium]|nr:efflux RND transporter periplasmic adaptor subunit [bacterium]